MSAVGTDQMTVKVLFQGSTSGLPVQGFARDLDRVDDAAGRANRSLAGIGGAATAALATAGAAAATALVSVLHSAVEEAAKLEKGVREIGTLMGGLSKGEMRQMSKELGELAVSSGQAIGSLTKARYDIVSAGFGDASRSLEVLNASAQLAVAGVTEVSVTADLLTTSLNAYRRPAEDARDVSDDLFTIVRNGKTTMAELGANMGALIATAGPLDVSLEEVGAALSTLTAQGQNTAMASTAVSAAILELSKPSKELTDALAAIGVQSDNLIKSGGGLAGALDLVKQASEATGVPVNRLVAREEALRAVLSLTSTAAEKFTDDLASMGDNAGATDKAFRDMADSADFLGTQAKEAFGRAQRAIGDAIIESDLYRDSLRGVRDFFDELADSFITGGDQAVRSSTDIIRAMESIAIVARETKGAISGIAGAIDAFEVAALKKLGVSDKSATGWVNNPFAWLTAVPGGLDRYYKAPDARQWGSKGYDKAWSSLVQSYIAPASRYIPVGGSASTTQEDPVVRPSRTITPVGGGGGGSSRAAAESEAERAIREHTKAVDEASEWYEKQFGIGGDLYEAFEDLREGTEKLTLINKEGKISGQQAAEALALLGDKAMELVLAKQFDMPTEAEVSALQKDSADTDQYGRKVEKTTSAIYDLGNTLESRGVAIKGWDSFAQSYEAFAEYFSPANQELGAQKSYSGLYKGIGMAVSGIGAAIGGGIGDALSSTAGMALMGLEVGGPVGAVIGGVVGLVSSLFGGGSNESQDRANRDDMRMQVYNNMVQSALSGGSESLKLLRAGSFDYDKVKNLQDPGYPGLKEDTSERLFEDRGVGELQTLQTVLNVLDQAGQTMQQFAKPQMLRDLDSAGVLLEYTVATVGDLADATTAYWDQVIMTITGVSADTLQSAVLEAIEGNSAADAGQAFVDKYEEGIKSSIRSMAISQLVEDIAVPALQPILTALSQSMLAGDYSAASMAAYLSQAMTVMDTLSPAVSALAAAFDEADVSVAHTTSVSAADYATAAEYRRALAGIPGYADGGEMSDGWKIVGEQSWELMHTGPGRVISHDDSARMLDNRPLAGQIERLRQEMQESQDALERHVSNLYDLFDRWRQDDFTVKVAS